MNYSNRSGFRPTPNKSNWDQSLRSLTKTKKTKRIRKSLQYLLVLKKFDNVVDYKNPKLLSAFLNKYGKILPRRKTQLSIQQQRAVSKAIRKARALKIIPFTYDVKG
jgi:small subunit ribosomal protein S18